MRTHFIIFTAIFGLFLTACTKSEPKEVVQNKENPAINEPIENTEDIPKSNDCGGKTLNEGWHCQQMEDQFAFALPAEFKPYSEGDLFNFIAEKENNFLHVAFYPLISFNKEAQGLLNENKLKEYLEYEQKNICDRIASCKSTFDASTFSEVKIGEQDFARYDVKMETDPPFVVTHYATIANGLFLDFSTSNGEEISYPADSETKVSSTQIEEGRMEEILTTLVLPK